MGHLFHKSVGVVVSRLIGAGIVHDIIRVQNVKFNNKVCHQFEGYHQV